jgi:hypothetical protein
MSRLLILALLAFHGGQRRRSGRIDARRARSGGLQQLLTEAMRKLLARPFSLSRWRTASLRARRSSPSPRMHVTAAANGGD